jgi:hypothetical protein
LDGTTVIPEGYDSFYIMQAFKQVFTIPGRSTDAHRADFAGTKDADAHAQLLNILIRKAPQFRGVASIADPIGLGLNNVLQQFIVRSRSPSP